MRPSPEVSKRPTFSADAAAQLAMEHFGKSGRIEELPSERDQNFLLHSGNGEDFVLKVANPCESRSFLELQNEAMHRTADAFEANDACPRPQVGNTGKCIIDLEAGHLRLLTYLPGTPLAKFRPQSTSLLNQLGAFLAGLDAALEGLDAPDDLDVLWNLEQAGPVFDECRALLNSQQAELVQPFVAAYSHIPERLADLPLQLIHNDPNDYNVLVSVDSWRPRISGLIDFGDMLGSRAVVDLAIACAYVMLDKRDPLAAASHVIAGYHRVRPLSEVELDLLFPLITSRLAMSVCIAAKQGKAAPEVDYLRVSEQPIWNALEQLREVPGKLAHYRFRSACGYAASSATDSIRGWLKKEKGNFASVLTASNPIVLDLSISSLEFSSEDDITQAEKFTDLVVDRIAEAGADFGVGRYRELRGVYRGTGYARASDDFPERRSLHLGVDLFMPAGTAVRAPVAGVVHSLQENRADLDYGPTIILEHNPAAEIRFYTLYGHLSRESIAHLNVGDRIETEQTIAWLGAPPINGNWPPHVHFQIIVDMLGMTGNYPGVAAPSERDLWLGLCLDPNLILGIDSLEPAPLAEVVQLGKRREQLLGSALSLAYAQPLHIVHGRGCSLYDSAGQAYLDLVNNVCHVGHCHPRVVRAARRQSGLLNTNTRYLHENILRYAERLSAKLPDPLEVCYFVCSGSEANELALRMARCHSGSKDLLVLAGAYHGNSQALIDASPYKHKGEGGKGPPAWVHELPMPDAYRGLFRGNDAAACYVADAGKQIAELVSKGQRPGTLLAEPLLGCGGQVVPPPGYLRELYKAVRKAGGVCIADEVQVGFGRVGSEFWAFQTQDVIPDIVTLGKPIGNGHPLAAVVTTKAIADSFANGMEYFNTFGGNPVSCAVGLAVLDVIEDEQLQENALRVGAHLHERLSELGERHELIGEVRGLGLFLGIELVLDRNSRKPAPQHAAYIIERMKEKGILLSSDGPDHNVLKIKPPMVISAEEADRFVDAMDSVLSENPLLPL